MKFTFTFDDYETALLSEAVGAMPYNRVYVLMDRLRSELKDQIANPRTEQPMGQTEPWPEYAAEETPSNDDGRKTPLSPEPN